MPESTPFDAPERIHPSLWRASQLARASAHTARAGWSALEADLPARGWPLGSMIELLAQHPGIGEIRMLHPALSADDDSRPIVLIQPPHTPQFAAWDGWGGDVSRLVWIRTQHACDALWAAVQVLRSGAFAGVLLWQATVRTPDLRRLHLAAQAGDTLFAMIRPASFSGQASPAPLRLALHPAHGGLDVDIFKRRGRLPEAPLRIPLYPITHDSMHHEPSLDRRASAPRRSRHARVVPAN